MGNQNAVSLYFLCQKEVNLRISVQHWNLEGRHCSFWHWSKSPPSRARVEVHVRPAISICKSQPQNIFSMKMKLSNYQLSLETLWKKNRNYILLWIGRRGLVCGWTTDEEDLLCENAKGRSGFLFRKVWEGSLGRWGCEEWEIGNIVKSAIY